MPDEDFRTQPAPATWGEAFAQLPLEVPPAGGWQRTSRRLARGRQVPRWPTWLALAAALGLVALLPMRRADDAQAPAVVAHVAVAAAPAVQQDAAVRKPARRVQASPAPVQAPRNAPAGRAPERRLATVATGNMRGVGSATATQQGVRNAEVAPPAHGAPLPVAATESATAAAPLSGDEARAAALAGLQAESARLESLLAMARDDRVANGTALALADELDRQVASVDAALREPVLDDAAREQLWRQRVDALREGVAFETTQRLLSNRGERYDARLVSID